MQKPTLEHKVDLLLDVLGKFLDAAHKHNETFRDAIIKLTDLRTMQDYLGHRDPKHTVHYARVAGRRFEGLWEK